jgi:hypothetical protein
VGHAASPQAQQAAAPEWSLLKDWSGQGSDTLSEPFTTTTPAYRVSWTMTELERDGLMDIAVRNPERRLVGMASNLRATLRPSGAFQVQASPGEYTLEVRFDGVKWRIAVEQPR